MASASIHILDFGSQYTQLIARRIRECQVYCEIYPYDKAPQPDQNVKGIILSGSPYSIHDPALKLKPDLLEPYQSLGVLGICFGAQYLAHVYGGEVLKNATREYGAAKLEYHVQDLLLENVPQGSQVWMSHGDSIRGLGSDCQVLAENEHQTITAFKLSNRAWYGLQFHPEVVHSVEGKTILANFVYKICNCAQNWSSESFIKSTVHEVRARVGKDKVIMALSGGVDSSVAAALIQKAIGKQLSCIFVNNGLLRKGEFEKVLESYKAMNLNIKGIDESAAFYKALYQIADPEAKRRRIGKLFIAIFEQEAEQDNINWLGQGTIYPDVIESISVQGPSQVIKSHHNVGGLPERMNLKLLEPLRCLFKDEVRAVGKKIGLPDHILDNHPFPGPGLAIRIPGAITPSKIKILQDVDQIFIDSLKEANLYDQIWQAGALLLPVKSVGVMGDERSYQYVVALRAVTSVDGMTADWFEFPAAFLKQVSNKIINQVQAVNRVVYDISSKPPATIEWE